MSKHEKDVRERLVALILNEFNPSPHGGTWRLNPDAAADAILTEFPVLAQASEVEHVDADDFIGKTFAGRDQYDSHRRITVVRVSPNQMRGGKPAKSTVYECVEGKGQVWESHPRIQAHILKSKWLPVEDGA